MKAVVPVFLLCLVVLVPAIPQTISVGTWRSYTTMLDIRDGLGAGKQVFAATGGGLFVYDRSTAIFTRTTNADGMSTNDLTAVGADEAGHVWVGGSGGEVHVLDHSDGTLRAIMDIAQAPRLQKGIRSFVPGGDTVFVVSEFGVSVFRTDKWEFGDTYANFPIAAAPTVRNAAVFKDSLWVASGVGLLVGWLGNTNLSAPTSWAVVTSPGGLSSDVTDLVVLNDTLFCATSNGLAIHGGTGLTSVPAQAGRPIQRLVPEGSDMLLLSRASGVTTIYRSTFAFDGGVVVAAPYAGTGNDVVFDADENVYSLLTDNQGMVEHGISGWERRNPDVPGIGVFYHVAVDEDGTLWAGSGINSGGQGFVRFSSSEPPGSQWLSFTVGDHPILASNDYYKASPVRGGSVWMSSWGHGTVEVYADSVVRKIDTQSTPSVASSVAGAPTFAVIGSVVEDDDAVVWMANRTAVNGNVLAKLLPDGTMEYVKNQLPGAEGRFTSMVIDRNGTKWLANSEPTAKVSTGLYFYNEDLLVDGTSSAGGWGQLTSNDGLPNNTVISLAVDLDGDIWVGTDLGVSIITNPRSPRSRRMSSFPLREQSIQSIAVDALNRKWVGTKEGVLVVSSDGSRLLEQYTVASTGGTLIDDDVRSIAIDQRRGIVYMGTEQGLSALWIAAVGTERSYSALDVGPNPFMIPGAADLTIRNLVENSTIKILTVDGRLVSEFAAQGGGRAFWDGRDSAGAYVSSGVYLIIAFADNGEQVIHGKVVVVRK